MTEPVELGPEIWAYSDALPGNLCDELVVRFESDTRRARRDTRPPPAYENRHCEMLFITPLPEWREFDRRIRAALRPVLGHHYFDVMKLPRSMRYVDEGYDLGCYRPPGDSCDEHFDGAEGRITSVLLYLNTVAEGGETVFPRRKLAITPVRGTAIVFPPHYTHLHYAEKPVSGPRYFGVSWIRRVDGNRQPYDNKPPITPVEIQGGED